MEYIATFDIGTTAIKAVLVSVDLEVICSHSKEITTLFNEDWKEQDVSQWYTLFCECAKEFTKRVKPEEICGIVMSGQMQDVILLSATGDAICNAILYSDGRGEEQAEQIIEKIGLEELVQTTANGFDGSIPFAKLLWMKQNQPEQYSKAHKIVFSAKDAVIAKLTGMFVSDVTSCATSGLMSLQQKKWQLQWMESMELNGDILPEIHYGDEVAGVVTQLGAADTGFLLGTPVYTGTGDAGATTLASGIANSGEYNINLGTSGWVAGISAAPLVKTGVFNLAAMSRGQYITVVPFLNAGNVHKWISKTLAPDSQQKSKYDYCDALLAESVPGSHGLLFLPYLTGERFPIMDGAIRGGFAGISPETTKQDMARAALESVAFSIRQGLQVLDAKPSHISIVGGGAKTPVWCQIFADVLQHSISVYTNSEYLPSLAVAAAALAGQKKICGYAEFTARLQEISDCVTYFPNKATEKLYSNQYEKYLRLYPALKMVE